MDLRNFKKNQDSSLDQNEIKNDLNKFKFNSDDLSSLAMSHLNSINQFSQLNSVNVSQLLGKFVLFFSILLF